MSNRRKATARKADQQTRPSNVPPMPGFPSPVWDSAEWIYTMGKVVRFADYWHDTNTCALRVALDATHVAEAGGDWRDVVSDDPDVVRAAVSAARKPLKAS